jgi:uncharacterized membrane protein
MKFLGHPIHPILIVFPLGLLSTAVIFDLIWLATDEANIAQTAYYMIGAGIVAALIAAVFGLIDWVGLPSGTRAKKVGLVHAIANTTAVVLFIASFALRMDDPNEPTILAVILSLVGIGLASLGGWLGGELVYRLGISVDKGAHENSPNSLSDRPAAETSTSIF